MGAAPDRYAELAQLVFHEAGLQPECLQVYGAVMSGGQARAEDLPAGLNLPATAVERSVQDLVDRGFLRRGQDDPQVLRPLSPSVGVEALTADMEADLAQQLERLVRFRQSSRQFTEEFRTLRESTGLSSFERLDDAEAAVARLQELNHATTDEIVALVSSKPAPSTLQEARRLDSELLGRGVRIRAVYLESCRRDPDVMEYLQWMHAQGAEVRLAPTIPVRAQIFDRSSLVIAKDPRDARAGALLLQSEGIIAAVLRLFDHAWEGGADVFGPAPVEEGPSAVELELLRLLAAGVKDEAAARHLGVSVRTVRRMITDLSRRLKASSRFELGVKAAERGWVRTSRRPPTSTLSTSTPSTSSAPGQGSRASSPPAPPPRVQDEQ